MTTQPPRYVKVERSTEGPNSFAYYKYQYGIKDFLKVGLFHTSDVNAGLLYRGEVMTPLTSRIDMFVGTFDAPIRLASNTNFQMSSAIAAGCS
jgi:hypothetical protein